jgi:hypothetical protein
MQVTGVVNDIGIDYVTKKAKITLLVNERECLNSIQKLKDDKLSIEIKKQRNKRSLDANSYCWVICDKIAQALSVEGGSTTKEDVYKDAVLQVGRFEPIIVTEVAYDNFKRIWENQGLGFLVQDVSHKDKCVRVNCYYGSSTYDTKEMSLLINLLVDLAKSLNIETKPQAEIDSLLNSWR